MEDRTEHIRQNDKEILFSDGSPMGCFWMNCKSKKKCDNQPYKKLLENQVLKNDYEKYIKKFGGKKDVTPLLVTKK
jgi:hypothetical protein